MPCRRYHRVSCMLLLPCMMHCSVSFTYHARALGLDLYAHLFSDSRHSARGTFLIVLIVSRGWNPYQAACARQLACTDDCERQNWDFLCAHPPFIGSLWCHSLTSCCTLVDVHRSLWPCSLVSSRWMKGLALQKQYTCFVFLHSSTVWRK